MKLRKLDALHFGALRRASVRLEPGLNVLHGPNELGKSTLGRAARAALLLPHSSSASAPFQSWFSAESPEASVEFELEGRIWRVRKRFGDKGTSSLESSRDGFSFSSEMTGRGVDGKLRELLRWGIRVPGGQGSPKGLPESFLARVLMGEQSDVAAVLSQSLAQDTDETGRERLTAALETLARDPLFRRILERTERKVGEAYTDAGRRKRGVGSPFTKVSEEVAQTQRELEALRAERRRALEIRDRVAQLQRELDERTSERDDARQRWTEARSRAESTAARSALAIELEQARGTLEAHRAQYREVATLDEEQRLGLASLAKMSAQIEATQNELITRKDTAARAAAALSELESERSKLELQASRSEQELAENRHRGSEQQSLLERLDRVARIDAQLRELATELVRRREEEISARQSAESTRARVEEEARELEAWELARALGELARSEREIARLEQLDSEVERELRAAATKRNEARTLRDSVRSGLPDRRILTSMRRISRERDIAQARLGGGLSIRLDLKQPIQILSSTDDGPPSIAHQSRIRAERKIVLRLGELGTIEINAGSSDALAEVERAERAYASEVRWPLEQLAIESLDALEAAIASSEALHGQAEQCIAEAERIEARAKVRTHDGAELAALRAELESRSARIRQSPGHARAREIAKEAEFEARHSNAKEVLMNLRAELVKLDAALQESITATRLGGERAALLRAQRETEWNALLETIDFDQTGGEIETLRTSIGEDLVRLRARSEALEKQLRELGEKERAKRDDAQRNADEARRSLDECEHRILLLRADERALRERLASIEGELKAKRAGLDGLDLDSDSALVATLEERLGQLPSSSFGPEESERTRRALEDAEKRLESAQAELLQARGELRTLGGSMIEERLESAEEGHRLATMREQEIDVEYDAYRMLRDKLREAEATDGLHLGEALAKPISEAFTRLTEQRYERLILEPQLGARGVELGGQLRDLAALSVGTREQLATLLRVVVAKQLGSMVILDDHLTQTDTERAKWFAKLLREYAAETQIVVLTCHPRDYLSEDELTRANSSSELVGEFAPESQVHAPESQVHAPESQVHAPESQVHAIDLTRCIERFS